MKLLTIETHASPPLRAAGRTLTLFNQAWTLRLPGKAGGLVWNRPAAVLVQSADGSEEIIRIKDFTRLAIWMLGGFTILIGVATWFALKRKG
jgi:hypothetical protein